MRFGLADVGGINRAIGSGVADKHAHRTVNDTANVAGGIVHIRQAYLDRLRIGHASEIDDVVVRVVAVDVGLAGLPLFDLDDALD